MTDPLSSRTQQLRFALATAFLLLPKVVQGYSFSIDSAPKQCQNTTFQITGSGSPPYSLLLVPTGPTVGRAETRKIQNIPFPDGSKSLSVQMLYPANSVWVAVISDSTGFATGGTSAITTVQSSSDNSCINYDNPVQAAFYFNINPLNQIIQCEATRFWWDNTNNTIHGTPKFQALIPGGESSEIPVGSITTVANQGTGYNWTPNIRQGTQILLVGGDDRGIGNAGSQPYTVGVDPVTNNAACIDASSPSSTPGTPAGAVTGQPPSGNGNSGSTNIGAIVGGVVGGIVALIAIALATIFYLRRKRFQKANKERPALFQDNDDEGPSEARRENLPLYYEPEPFTLPEPTEAGASFTSRPSTDNRRQSELTYMTDLGFGRAGTPDGGTALTGSSRKSPNPPTLRPVNVIQHEDAGPSGAPGEPEEPETVELPPAYTNIRS